MGIPAIVPCDCEIVRGSLQLHKKSRGLLKETFLIVIEDISLESTRYSVRRQESWVSQGIVRSQVIPSRCIIALNISASS